ncbi:MAG TPA: AgmX/PglI C-terminal domain-containing protein, partial [Kofleriaceae bacterium]|nr:AgmX/PglI C-terminal domain-containing protein [Kofleriaceae bacterium]
PAPLATSAIPVEYQDIDILIPDFTPPQKVTSTAPGTAKPVAPNQTPIPIVRRQTIRPAITTGNDVDPAKLAGLFTNDDAAARRPGMDLGKQIIDARNNHVEVGKDSAPDPSPRLGTQPDLPLTDPTLTHVDPTHGNEPKGRIIPGTIKEQAKTTLTPSLVLQLIQSQYIRGLQRCYQRGLATEGASLAGKVSIEFTVEESGKVSDSSASGMSSTVDTCIEGQMSTWRFPAPHDAQGAATEASFSITLALQPS